MKQVWSTSLKQFKTWWCSLTSKFSIFFIQQIRYANFDPSEILVVWKRKWKLREDTEQIIYTLCFISFIWVAEKNQSILYFLNCKQKNDWNPLQSFGSKLSSFVSKLPWDEHHVTKCHKDVKHNNCHDNNKRGNSIMTLRAAISP